VWALTRSFGEETTMGFPPIFNTFILCSSGDAFRMTTQCAKICFKSIEKNNFFFACNHPAHELKLGE